MNSWHLQGRDVFVGDASVSRLKVKTENQIIGEYDSIAIYIECKFA